MKAHSKEDERTVNRKKPLHDWSIVDWNMPPSIISKTHNIPYSTVSNKRDQLRKKGFEFPDWTTLTKAEMEKFGVKCWKQNWFAKAREITEKQGD